MSDLQQVSVTPTTAELTGLDKFTNYTIFVEAFTVALGTMSYTVTVVTSEDGQLLKLSVYTMLFEFILF